MKEWVILQLQSKLQHWELTKFYIRDQIKLWMKKRIMMMFLTLNLRKSWIMLSRYVEKIIHNRYGSLFWILLLPSIKNMKNQTCLNNNFKYSSLLMDKLWRTWPPTVQFSIQSIYCKTNTKIWIWVAKCLMLLLIFWPTSLTP